MGKVCSFVVRLTASRRGWRNLWWKNAMRFWSPVVARSGRHNKEVSPIITSRALARVSLDALKLAWIASKVLAAIICRCISESDESSSCINFQVIGTIVLTGATSLFQQPISWQRELNGKVLSAKTLLYCWPYYRLLQKVWIETRLMDKSESGVSNL